MASRSLWKDAQGTSPTLPVSEAWKAGMWWDGQSSAYILLDANGNLYGPEQNDVSVLTAALGLAPDRQGVIETLADTDAFPFHASGLTTVRADVAAVGPMLDLKLEILDSAGVRVAGADTASLGEVVTLNLPDGDYTAVVGSHGGYGDLGTYTVTAVPVPEPSYLALVFLALFISLRTVRHHHGRPSPHGTSLTPATYITSGHARRQAASRSGASTYADVTCSKSPHWSVRAPVTSHRFIVFTILPLFRRLFIRPSIAFLSGGSN